MYKSDSSDAECDLLATYLQLSERRGSGAKHELRTIVNAILYVVKVGIEWRMLPNDFPPRSTVYYHLRQLKQKGLWSQALDVINKIHRTKKDRNETQGYGWD